MANSQLKALSLAALARRLDLPYPRAQSLVNDGVLVPSVIGPNNLRLFPEGDIETLRAAVLGHSRKHRRTVL